MRPALLANQQRIALRVIPRPRSARHDAHQAAIGIIRLAGRNPLADDGASAMELIPMCLGQELLAML